MSESEAQGVYKQLGQNMAGHDPAGSFQGNLHGSYPQAEQVAIPPPAISLQKHSQGYMMEVIPQNYPSEVVPQNSYPQGFPQENSPQVSSQEANPKDFSQGDKQTNPQGNFPPPYPVQNYPPGIDPAPVFKPDFSGSDQANYEDGSHNLAEDGVFRKLDFTDRSIRRSFIRKVYGILTCQLMVTISFIALFLFHEPTKFFIQKNPILAAVGLVVGMICVVTMVCSTEVRRRAPMNLIFLGVFTVAESFVLGCLTSNLNSSDVMIAVGITAAIFLGLTLFAFQTKWDFTLLGGGLLVALVILFVYGSLALFIRELPKLRLLCSAGGVLIFSLYIIYDTQLMMGGEHKYSVSPEEYVFAALNLYLDIINLLVYVLRIMNSFR